MPVQEEFIAQAAPFRAELIAHCYRMLGSVHDAEDLVQETYLRGWRGYSNFEERAALRTWLYRIATTACLRALENRARRVLPAGLGAGSVDPDVDLDGGRRMRIRGSSRSPTRITPESAFAARHSVRLAVVTAMQELPARQRAVLILRDVVQFSAAEVAELLETTPAAVNSALQRARTHLAEAAPTEDDVADPDDAATTVTARPVLRGIRERRHRGPHRIAARGRQTRNAAPSRVVRRTRRGDAVPRRPRVLRTGRRGDGPDDRQRPTRGRRLPAWGRRRVGGPCAARVDGP